MRINNTQSVNFQKKLIGLGAIRQEDISKTVKFFQLDDVSDMLDLKKARKTSNWFGNFYLNDVVSGDGYHIQKYDVFTMEDDAQNILGFSVLERSGPKTQLAIIETAPKLSCYQEKRSIKYIGETMMAFIAKLSGNKDVVVTDIAQRPKTKNFYFSQCKFSKIPFSESAILKRRNFSKLIKKNEAHTGRKIELIK